MTLTNLKDVQPKNIIILRDLPRYKPNQQEKRKETGIEDLETRIPTSKTTNIDSYKLYTRYMLTHLDTFFNFYGSSSAKGRFTLYQGRQRAPELMVDLPING